MFHPLGLFKQIACPRQHDCNLHNCVFSHETSDQQNGTTASEAYDPFSAGEPEPPPSKRRKIESAELVRQPRNNVTSSLVVNQGTPRPSVNDGQTKAVDITQKPKSQYVQQAAKLTKPQQPTSVQRTVSPPPKKQPQAVVPEKEEKLIPRPVAKAPAVLKVRMSFTEILYKQVNAVNSQIKNGDPNVGEVKLSDQQLIKWVLDEEEQAAAKLASDIYRNAMSQKVLQMKRMKVEEWKRLIQEKIKPPDSEIKKTDEVTTGLSPEEECQVVRYLRTNLTGLDIHGYVTKPPSITDVQKAKDTIKATGGYELCDRCGVRFQVFPGRDDQGRLTTNGECHYHWAKTIRAPWQRTDHITGQAQSSFPCCGRQTGSEGCTRATTHVFKVTDPKRLAVLLQFEQTPIRSDGKKRNPIAFDCEMAYTTYGMEVVRVTAVSWPGNETILDVLVRPYGEILDLNTRFSGVTPEQYNEALPYDAVQDGESRPEEGEVMQQSLRKVDSPAVARQLIFDFLAPDTPLIGHAIENDLNTCRIVHPFVVDTVLLYPHPKGLPIRYGLKMLTSKYLNRNIQMGGDSGHDSKEDSVATGDLVRLKVGEKWQTMRLQGWKFHEGSLVPPGR